MPELPEVEAARRAVEEHCLGKKIKRAVVADDPKVVEGVTPADFEAALVGKTILQALRKGKNLWLRLDSPPFPSFQFGMTGAIYIKGVAVTKYKRSAVNTDEEWPSKYSKVFLELDDGLELSFTDKRRFARVRLLQDPGSMPPISELGPDALLEPMELDEFVKSLSSKKTPIKALLLDQSYISGIGNWVADEVLYHARIHPLQTAASLSREKCEVLHKCIKEVIHFAIEVDADCSHFPVEWLFHFRWGKKSAKVNGKKIEFITAGGRTTAFVPELQKLDGDTSGEASGGKSRKSRSAKLSGDEMAANIKEDDDREDEVGEDEGSRLKSKLVEGERSQGTGGTAKKKPSTKRSSRAYSDVEKESVTEGEREKEESDMEKKRSTRKPKPKKGKSTTGDTKRPPAKNGTGSAREKGGAQKKKMARGAAKKQPEVKEKTSTTKRTKAEQASAQQARKRRK